MSTATLERSPIASVSSDEPLNRIIELQFSTAAEVNAGLERAVANLIEVAARETSCGILVTRLRPGCYTVALDASVPFGETFEAIAA